MLRDQHTTPRGIAAGESAQLNRGGAYGIAVHRAGPPFAHGPGRHPGVASTKGEMMKPHLVKPGLIRALSICAIAAILAVPLSSQFTAASSHREAPLIS